MKALPVISAVSLNVVLWAAYYIGLAQDQPADASVKAPNITASSLAANSASKSFASVSSRHTDAQQPANEFGRRNATDASPIQEVLDGKEVLPHNQEIGPAYIAPVAEYSEPLSAAIQPQLPTTEFRQPKRRLGISAAPNSANLELPVISPETR